MSNLQNTKTMNYNLLYKVGKNENYKTYTKGQFKDVHNVFNSLRERAAAKSFTMTKRSQGNMGVILTYSRGTESVVFIICNDEELRLWWSNKVA